MEQEVTALLNSRGSYAKAGKMIARLAELMKALDKSGGDHACTERTPSELSEVIERLKDHLAHLPVDAPDALIPQGSTLWRWYENARAVVGRLTWVALGDDQGEPVANGETKEQKYGVTDEQSTWAPSGVNGGYPRDEEGNVGENFGDGGEDNAGTSAGCDDTEEADYGEETSRENRSDKRQWKHGHPVPVFDAMNPAEKKKARNGHAKQKKQKKKEEEGGDEEQNGELD
jgi:hypothetical protein